MRKIGEPAPPPPSILVVDDDRRVRELLEVALTAHGFGVVTAVDGEEAIKRALGQRPDLIVLDVRLPKKSGLEVCEVLRGDPEDPSVPIILVSAAAETDARLQAFSRGADDYLAKPFSPKELIARIKRLLSRHAEARTAQRRARDLERELARAQEEARRAHLESRREQRLHELAIGLGRELLKTLDCDALAQRFLLALRGRLGVGAVSLLIREREGGALIPRAICGDDFERVSGLEVRGDGELARMLAGLGRPVLHRELERISELADELPPLVARGFALLAPIRGIDGLDALLVIDERLDGLDPSREDLEALSSLCEIAGVAIQNALRFREQVDHSLQMLGRHPRSDAHAETLEAEAATLVMRAAATTLLPPRQRGLLPFGLRLGVWALSDEGRAQLSSIRLLDVTGRVEELMTMIDLALDPADLDNESAPERRRAAVFLGAGFFYLEARMSGAAIDDSLSLALERMGARLDRSSRQALEAAARETLMLQGDAA